MSTEQKYLQKQVVLVGYGRVGRRLADSLAARKMVETARTLNPDIEIVLRTHSEDESEMLIKDGLGTVFYGEEELAKGMANHVLARFGERS